MAEETKYMDIKEFRETGYLQELNRSFLHPLGLAMEIRINEDGTECLGGIWDYRSDPEGIVYEENFFKKKSAIEKRDNINAEFDKKAVVRMEQYGWVIQPVGE